MSKPKLTPWFSGDVMPMHKGVYERDDSGKCMDDGEPNFSKWDGDKWCCSRWSAREAKGQLDSSWEQNLPWRGLTEPADAAQ